jgi:NAD(P)H-dependent FMN reductase
MHLQGEGLRVLAISGSLRSASFSTAIFTDEQSLAFIDNGLRRLRQQILIPQEVSA